MDERRRLCSLVLESGMSLSAACRLVGVSRPTGHSWVSRAREVGISQIAEVSRAPKSRPKQTSFAIESKLMEAAKEYPFWGARKLLCVAFEPGDTPICERTAGRILQRKGHRVMGFNENQALQRFEKSACNELWQIDFKRVGRRRFTRDVLSVLDDSSRFCVALKTVPDQTLESVQNSLWAAFEQFGLPEAILSDNGPAFRNNATWRWSKFDLWLMLLGIKPLHGRPYHPQTQGKVERFHGTMERERVTPDSLDEFRNRYNWVRPHEAIALQKPGQIYQRSPRQCPAQLPKPEYPADCNLRKTDGSGVFSYKGKQYKAGRALDHQTVAIQESHTGPVLIWAGTKLCHLDELLR